MFSGEYFLRIDMQAGNVASPTSIQDCSHRFMSNINIRKANVDLAVIYGESWYLILTFVNFTISCSCELRVAYSSVLKHDLYMKPK